LRLHHDRIKQLSGGDSMSAANKYEKAFEFEPVCKLWLACNKRPQVTDDTAAFWARVFLIPFTASFVGQEDRTLRPSLVQEPAHQAAVLAWIVRGAVRYCAEGLEPPPSIRAATAAYREDSDPIAAFLYEACELTPNADVSAQDLYAVYSEWADRQHFSQKERLTATAFGRLMAERFQRVHTEAGRVYRGLARR
jgi:putative DNA primase/helicase